MNLNTKRVISWVRSARKTFDDFPEDAQKAIVAALNVAAEGGMSGIAKPMKGLGGGIFEIALSHRGNAFRTIYAVQIGAVIWVVHAFQKKSNQGIKTPKYEIDLVRERIKRIKELMK